VVCFTWTSGKDCRLFWRLMNTLTSGMDVNDYFKTLHNVMDIKFLNIGGQNQNDNNF
jgi:hypothetical protein